MRYLFTCIIVSSLFWVGIWHATDADAAPADRTWRGCIHEDGSSQRRCIWDARHMGNGEGRSFISRDFGNSYRYVTHRRAHRLLHS